MTAVAIAFMVLAILIVWGGLALSIWFLVRHPLDDDAAEPTDDAVRGPDRGGPNP